MLVEAGQGFPSCTSCQSCLSVSAHASEGAFGRYLNLLDNGQDNLVEFAHAFVEVVNLPTKSSDGYGVCRGYHKGGVAVIIVIVIIVISIRCMVTGSGGSGFE